MNITNKYKDDRYFKTTSFYLSAFLFTKGLELVNINPTESGRSEFVFNDRSDREILLHVFSFGKENSPDVLVDVRKFVMAIKMLKDKLYQNRF